MLTVVIVERSAEARHRLTKLLEETLLSGAQEFQFVPRVTFVPLALEEVHFHEQPDACVIGEELIQSDHSSIEKVRAAFQKTTVLVRCPGVNVSLAELERFAKLGADDLLTASTSPREFLHKLIFIAKKEQSRTQGKLIVVVSAKGGVGVSSVAAAVAETLVTRAKETILVDLDHDSQDVSRFLQARPYVNEHLHLCLRGEQAVSPSYMKESLVTPWSDEQKLRVFTPAPALKEIYTSSERICRVMHGVFEELDHLSDYVVVDAGCTASPLQDLALRLADVIVFVLSPDPAALFACIERVAEIKTIISPAAQLKLLINGERPGELSSKILIEEFSIGAGISAQSWCSRAIPYCARSARWPASGGTLAAQGNKRISAALVSLLRELSMIPAESSGVGNVQDDAPLLLPWFSTHPVGKASVIAKDALFSSAKTFFAQCKKHLTRSRSGVEQIHKKLLATQKYLPAPKKLDASVERVASSERSEKSFEEVLQASRKVVAPYAMKPIEVTLKEGVVSSSRSGENVIS